MAKSNSTLKQEALDALEGKWGLAIGAFVVYFLIIIAIQFIPFLGGIISFLVTGPFTLGIAIFSLAVSRNQEPKLEQVFQGFNNFGNALVTYLLLVLIVLAWALIAIIPFIIGMVVLFAGALSNISPANMTADTISELSGNGTSMVYMFALLLGFFILLIPAIIVSLSYSQAFFVLADEPEISGFKALSKSKQLMNGYKWKYFLLGLSFIGWILLSILTLFLGYFVLFPYMRITLAKFYEDRKAEFENSPLEVV